MNESRKITTRSIIEELIQKADVALSHQELQGHLGDRCNRVTIYRILDKLVAEGSIHKIVDINGVSKYAACKELCEQVHNHDHVHFSCVKCQSVTCLDDIKPIYHIPENYKVQECNFTLSGVCPSCI